MPFLRRLGSQTTADSIPPEVFQWANAGQNDIETKLGLNNTGRIVLDIIKSARRAKRHRAACTHIADQVYHLVNALDGGVKGRAIDINPVLYDHIGQLNQDLERIRQKMKSFGTWWIFARSILREPVELQTCQEILDHRMDMYVLLLRIRSCKRRGKSEGHPFPSLHLGRRREVVGVITLFTKPKATIIHPRYFDIPLPIESLPLP